MNPINLSLPNSASLASRGAQLPTNLTAEVDALTKKYMNMALSEGQSMLSKMKGSDHDLDLIGLDDEALQTSMQQFDAAMNQDILASVMGTSQTYDASFGTDLTSGFGLNFGGK